MRGEHSIPAAAKTSAMGSSPHARGALEVVVGAHDAVGIIPACAGSTNGKSTFIRFVRDHPRMRGEHGPIIVPVTPSAGSSPHARGALPRPEDEPRHGGIIPACAGSTRPPCPSRRTWRDHPRMRGEHRRIKELGRTVEGSSPHARGARSCMEADYYDSGIIPACAGSTIAPRGA